MFSYHSGLTNDDHFFRSPFYEWPFIVKPMWYYSGKGYMPEGMVSSISCMGNPAVWWFGAAAMLFVLFKSFTRMGRNDKRYLFIGIGFLSQYVPWIFVHRSTFIYHYFASVPFIILASVLMIDYIRRRNATAYRAVAWSLCGAALLLFIAFYPLMSGLPAPLSYVKYLRWFNWYNY